MITRLGKARRRQGGRPDGWLVAVLPHAVVEKLGEFLLRHLDGLGAERGVPGVVQKLDVDHGTKL